MSWEDFSSQVVSAAAHTFLFLFTPSNLPHLLLWDLRPPSVSFPESSLQARGGRVSLHVSPEMSHHLQHAHKPASLLLHPPCFSISCHSGRNVRERWGHLSECVSVRASVCVNFSVHVMKTVKSLHVAAEARWSLGSPAGLPYTAAGHREEGDYLIAASHLAQIKKKVKLQLTRREDCKSKHELGWLCDISLTRTIDKVCSIIFFTFRNVLPESLLWQQQLPLECFPLRFVDLLCLND